MKKIKIGVLGCGWIGIGAESDLLRAMPSTHVSGIRMNEHFQLVAIQDISTESKINSERFAPGVPYFTSAEKMLDEEKLEAVTIASPPETHCELITLCVRKGVKHILCEKPLSLDLKDAEAVIKLVKEYNVNLVINHMRRFSPLMIKTRDYIQNKYIRDTLIGTITSGVAFYDKGLFHCGTHILDLLTFFFGDLKAVSAIHSSVYKNQCDDIAPEAILCFESCQISLKPFNSTNYALAEINFYGEKGSLKLKDMWGRKVEFIGTQNCLDFSAYKELNQAGSKTLVEEEAYMTSTYRHFAHTISDNSKMEISWKETLHVIRALHAIKDSADQKGKLIELN